MCLDTSNPIPGYLFSTIERDEEQSTRSLRHLMRAIRTALRWALQAFQTTPVFRWLLHTLLPPIDIRIATPDDIPELIRLRGPGIESAFGRPDRVTNLIATAGKNAVGFVQLVREQQDNGEVEHWMHAMFVHPLLRRSGLGRQLTHHFIRLADEDNATVIFACVHQSNTPAIRLYQSSGFRFVDPKDSYFADKARFCPPDNRLMFKNNKH